MLLGDDFDSFFADAVEALKDYLDEVVCIGGCANALYRFHDLSSEVAWGFLGTHDIDAAVPQKLPLKDRHPVAELMDRMGFKERVCGNAEDAVIKYGPDDKGSAVDLEFLCEISGLSKADQIRAAVTVQDGLYAQPLRYLAMSLKNTWRVDLGRVPGFERKKGVNIQVPNPAAYVVSKILIRGEKRKPASMAKDCFYIYEISSVFRDALGKIRDEYDRLEPCTPNWKKRFAKNARSLFESEYAEGPISAVGVYKALGELSGQNFVLTEEIVCRSVGALLDAILD
jgi:hypothetical protein